jgi:hypothetical protein
VKENSQKAAFDWKELINVSRKADVKKDRIKTKVKEQAESESSRLSP